MILKSGSDFEPYGSFAWAKIVRKNYTLGKIEIRDLQN